ncbi:hypothetical protein [Luteimonas padinae]|uniref:hypothetical protein n=1 Tax=Luteimonas padinae TaxID=1714359 RepID=UPI001E43BB2C|nr:hypothetical protein [Luteimonas padinae]
MAASRSATDSWWRAAIPESVSPLRTVTEPAGDDDDGAPGPSLPPGPGEGAGEGPVGGGASPSMRWRTNDVASPAVMRPSRLTSSGAFMR